MSRAPNILFLLPDQHRPDWTGANSELPLRTPVLDALAARGMTFRRAYTPSPVCAPARACLASGRSYDDCGVPGNEHIYPLDWPTYYSRLRDVGYRVAGVGKLDLHKDTRDTSKLYWGLDGSRSMAEWGFTDGIDNEGKMDGGASYRVCGEPRGPYLKALADRGWADRYVAEHAAMRHSSVPYVTALPEDLYCDNWLTDNGLRILRDLPKGQPWHLVVNFTGPHNPFDVTQRMHDAWQDVDFPQPHRPGPDTPPAEHVQTRRHYAAMIENIDRLCGELIAAVEARGELDNTLIVFSSDHGEMLGDHGRWGKSTWREASAGIPLVVAGPGVQQGMVSDTLVSLHDLAATYLEIAAAESLPKMDAISLWPVLRGETPVHREHICSALGKWRAVITETYKLVQTGDTLQLYDRSTDPQEDHDIAADHPQVVAELRELL